MSGEKTPLPQQPLGGAVGAFVSGARAARLATSSADGAPHLVPVCFAVVGGLIYIGLDSKPKSVNPLRLRRVRNIVENPRVAFLVDVYDDDDWGNLGYALITGVADVDIPESERRGAIEALRAKYPQYERMLADDAPVIRVAPERVSAWGIWGRREEIGVRREEIGVRSERRRDERRDRSEE